MSKNWYSTTVFAALIVLFLGACEEIEREMRFEVKEDPTASLSDEELKLHPILMLDADHILTLNGQSTNREDLLEALWDLPAEQSGKLLILKVDPAVRSGTVIEVMDILERAGYGEGEFIISGID